MNGLLKKKVTYEGNGYLVELHNKYGFVNTTFVNIKIKKLFYYKPLDTIRVDEINLYQYKDSPDYYIKIIEVAFDKYTKDNQIKNKEKLKETRLKEWGGKIETLIIPPPKGVNIEIGSPNVPLPYGIPKPPPSAR